MKNRKGSITVVVLLMMTVVISTSIYMVYLVIIQTHIVNNSHKRIQSRIIADGNINRILNNYDNLEDILIPEIYKIVRTKIPPYITKDSNNDGIPDGYDIDLDFVSNIKSANLRLESSEMTMKKNFKSNQHFDESTSMILRIETEYEGIKDIYEIKGKVINKLFEIDEPFISENNVIEKNLVDEFHKLMDVFEDEVFDYEPKGTTPVVKINLDESVIVDDKYITDEYGNIIKTYDYQNYVLLNIKSTNDKKTLVQIKTNNQDKIKIKGNIYCEGDLMISSPFEIEGNLIINKGSLIVDTNFKPIIKGKLFYRGNENIDIDMLRLFSEKKYIYRYGSYLPGFIDIKIHVIKS